MVWYLEFTSKTLTAVQEVGKSMDKKDWLLIDNGWSWWSYLGLSTLQGQVLYMFNISHNKTLKN